MDKKTLFIATIRQWTGNTVSWCIK